LVGLVGGRSDTRGCRGEGKGACTARTAAFARRVNCPGCGDSVHRLSCEGFDPAEKRKAGREALAEVREADGREAQGLASFEAVAREWDAAGSEVRAQTVCVAALPRGNSQLTRSRWDLTITER
jgi:hypothetical protein